MSKKKSQNPTRLSCGCPKVGKDSEAKCIGLCKIDPKSNKQLTEMIFFQQNNMELVTNQLIQLRNLIRTLEENIEMLTECKAISDKKNKK